MSNLIKKIANYFSPASKKLREAKKIVPIINEKEEFYSKFTHDQIIAKTEEFRKLLSQGHTLEDILPDAFALVREASKRVLYQRPYDVQMMGAYILHNKMIAEMYTGEGKTLVAVIAAYLNGLPAKGLQIVTVNDYLAKRDSEETGKVLKYLGLKVGLIQENMAHHEKQQQYNADVTYVSNHEFAFDYLRDNMESYAENQVMINRINFCIVDEADSVLIDEASIPLIISGPGPKSSGLYEKLTPIVQKLDPKIHLQFDEFKNRAELTEEGMDFLEDQLARYGIIESSKNKLNTMNLDSETLVKDYLNLLLSFEILSKINYVSDGNHINNNQYFNEMIGLGEFNEPYDHRDNWRKKNKELWDILWNKKKAFFENKIDNKENNESKDINDDFWKEFNDEKNQGFFKNVGPLLKDMKPFTHYNYVYRVEKINSNGYDYFNLSPDELKIFYNNEPRNFISTRPEIIDGVIVNGPNYIRIDFTPLGYEVLKKQAILNEFLTIEGVYEHWTINKIDYKSNYDNITKINTNLYEPKNLLINHYINQIIRANFIMKIDVDYIVSKNSEVVIIDQHTGRLGFGRRFSDGLHQALEAKEKVEIKDENVTVASTTYQSFFQLFKLAGMTGTASESAEELMYVYNLEVVPIPTNRLSRKIIHKDILFFKNSSRLEYVVNMVHEKHKKQQPILIITLTVNDSEIIARALTRKKLPHQLLNAKNHEEEANIVREGGKLGSITVSTDIAGRGTDIQLGGSRSYLINSAQERGDSEQTIEKLMEQLEQDKKDVSETGGLCVICIGRHESERLDNQASGRCGRQGEPGEVHFILSLEDDLISSTMNGSSFQQWSLAELMDSDEDHLQGYLVDTLINTIQKSKGALNYESRKNLFRYDKIIDIQRKILYQIRNNLLRLPVVYENFNEKKENMNKSYFFQLSHRVLINIIEIILFNIDYTNKESIDGAKEVLYKLFNLNNDITIDNNHIIYDNILNNEFIKSIENLYKFKLNEKITKSSALLVAQNLKNQLISLFDKVLQKYLQAISDSKDGSYLSSYAQKDPINEFNKRMMGLLADFFVEWEKLFIENIFNEHTYENAENFKLNDNFDDNISMDEIKEFLKKHDHIFSNENSEIIIDNNIVDNEENRHRLKSDIITLLMDHLNNSGGIEYIKDNEKTVVTNDKESEELIDGLKNIIEDMDMNELKNFKDDLVNKIHAVRQLFNEESHEYQDAMLTGIQEITNLDEMNELEDGMMDEESTIEEIIEDLSYVVDDYSDEDKKIMIKEISDLIETMDGVKEINYEDDEDIDDILDSVNHLIGKIQPEQQMAIKQLIIKTINQWLINSNKEQ